MSMKMEQSIRQQMSMVMTPQLQMAIASANGAGRAGRTGSRGASRKIRS